MAGFEKSVAEPSDCPVDGRATQEICLLFAILRLLMARTTKPGPLHPLHHPSPRSILATISIPPPTHTHSQNQADKKKQPPQQICNRITSRPTQTYCLVSSLVFSPLILIRFRTRKRVGESGKSKIIVACF